MIAVLEVHELLTMIHDILDSVMSKQAGNTANILAYVFNFASRYHCVVRASQLPILHNIKDSIPSNEACLYGHINWLLAQANQQSTLGVFQSSTSTRGATAKP